MTRFTEETVQCLKETMRKRMPDCYFTKEDVEAIKAQTDLNELQILHWAANLRLRCIENEQKQDFLFKNIEVFIRSKFNLKAFKTSFVAYSKNGFHFF